MSDRTSVTRTIAAPAQELWEMVSDITRMGQWSPETTDGAWIKGATGPAVGARFKGDNQIETKTWSIVCEVTECEPAQTFAFDATAGPMRYAHWRYDFEATDGGTIVTESVVDKRNWLLKKIGERMTGVTDRASHNKRTMTETLAALAAEAERS